MPAPNDKPLKNFILITGDEFARKKKIEALLDELLPQSSRDTNLYRFYPDDMDLEEVVAQAKTISLLGDAQVFLVSQVDKMKIDWSLLETYSAQPVPQSFFIFQAETLPETHVLVKLSRKKGEHVHFEEKEQNQFMQWFQDKLKRAGKTMAPRAWQLLEERLGASKMLMDLCLDQLILYARQDVIQEHDIEKLSTEFLKFEPFALTDALLQKETQKALEIFHYFYDLSGDLTGTIGLLHWQLKRVWQAKQMAKKETDAQTIARLIKVPPFRASSFFRQVQSFDLRQLERLLKDLWNMDWNSKTGALDELAAAEAFLVRAGTTVRNTSQN